MTRRNAGLKIAHCVAGRYCKYTTRVRVRLVAKWSIHGALDDAARTYIYVVLRIAGAWMHRGPVLRRRASRQAHAVSPTFDLLLGRRRDLCRTRHHDRRKHQRRRRQRTPMELPRHLHRRVTPAPDTNDRAANPGHRNAFRALAQRTTQPKSGTTATGSGGYRAAASVPPSAERGDHTHPSTEADAR